MLQWENDQFYILLLCSRLGWIILGLKLGGILADKVYCLGNQKLNLKDTLLKVKKRFLRQKRNEKWIRNEMKI